MVETRPLPPNRTTCSKNAPIRFASSTYDSPIGALTLCSDGANLCGLWIEGQKYHGASIPAPMEPAANDPALHEAATWLDAYFRGEHPDPATLPLAPIGSTFRQVVWNELLSIPYGELRTYGDIAQSVAARLGKEHMASLAVGGAVGHNPVSIIIPCHRVIGANRSLTGYAGGIGKKAWLLEHEGIDASKLVFPAKGTAL